MYVNSYEDGKVIRALSIYLEHGANNAKLVVSIPWDCTYVETKHIGCQMRNFKYNYIL